jgi:hypothetical protein
MQRPLYQHIATRVQAIATCAQTGNAEWLIKHRASIDWLVENYMPSGSGIDTGTKWDENVQRSDRLQFYFSYHHMNDGGMYDGWTDHVLTVKPSLVHGITINISGRDRNDVKEYLYQVFECALTQIVDDAKTAHLDAVAAA